MTARAARRSKPKSPETIAAERLAARARNFEAVGMQREAAALPAFADVHPRHGERDKADGAYRLDAFAALRDGMRAGAYDAARRLERDIALRYGEADRGATGGRVDGGSGVFGSTDIQIDAGRRVDAVMARIGNADARLLMALIRPAIIRGDWRSTVASVTGEINPVAQAAVVRQACANLASAYLEADRK